MEINRSTALAKKRGLFGGQKNICYFYKNREKFLNIWYNNKKYTYNERTRYEA